MGSSCQLRSAEDTASPQKLGRGKGGLPGGSQGKNALDRLDFSLLDSRTERQHTSAVVSHPVC